MKEVAIAIGILAGIVLGAALILWGTSAVAEYQAAEAQREQIAWVAASPFQVGDIVRSKVANFRGMVIGTNCRGPDDCLYQVRFYVATMQPVWLEEQEITLTK